MPRMDGTGPFGQGPATGCRRGICAGTAGRGFGRGICRWAAAPREDLTERKACLEKALEEINSLLEKK